MSLTLAGGVVKGLFSNSSVTKLVMLRSSTGSTAIRFPLMSSVTKLKLVTSIGNCFLFRNV